MSGGQERRVDARSARAQRDYAGWLLRAGVMLFFIMVGYAKFDSSAHGTWVPIFARIGLGQWFRYFTGVVEMLGGALYFPERTCRVGAALLAVTMLGAAVGLCTVLGSPVASIVPLTLLAAVIFIAFRVPEPGALRDRWHARRITSG